MTGQPLALVPLPRPPADAPPRVVELWAWASLPARLAVKIDPQPGGCWLWTASRNAQGYGCAWDGRRRLGAHRLIFTLLAGPIPDGLELDHVKARGCVSRACVNPAHLEPVTHRENTLRGDGPTARHAHAAACPQGHPYDEANTLRLAGGHRGCRTCDRAATAARMRARRAAARAAAA